MTSPVPPQLRAHSTGSSESYRPARPRPKGILPRRAVLTGGSLDIRWYLNVPIRRNAGETQKRQGLARIGERGMDLALFGDLGEGLVKLINLRS